MPTLQDLQKALERCTKPGVPPLYRNLYGLSPTETMRVHAWDDWYKLPFVTKDSMLQYHMRERSFLPPGARARLVTTTSGTSGKPPLFTFRQAPPASTYDFPYVDTNGDFLCSSPTFAPRIEEYMKNTGGKGRVLCLDSKHINASAPLVCASAVKSVFMSVFLIPAVSKLFSDLHIASRVTSVVVGGSTCSQALFELVHATFPNASIETSYGFMEVEGPVATTSLLLAGQESFGVYGAVDGVFFELMDPETGQTLVPRPDTEGELVLTQYAEMVAPIIRYRTGDIVRVVKRDSNTPGNWSFTVLGRTTEDYVRIPGGLLRADEIERVLYGLRDRVTDIFTAQVREGSKDSGIKLKVSLLVQPIGSQNMTTLAEDISRRLRVGPSYTYADGVRDGHYEPLVCKALGAIEVRSKHKRIVRQ